MSLSETDLVDGYPDIFEYYMDAEGFTEQFEQPPPSIALFGFQHQSGWTHLLESLCEYISRQEIDVKVVQSKEKFGGLRVYTNIERAEDVDERRVQQVFGAIQMAQEMSFHVCECCGSPGSLRDDGGWLKTRCSECYGSEE